MIPSDGRPAPRIRGSWVRRLGQPAEAIVFGVCCWEFGPTVPAWDAAIVLNLGVALAAVAVRWDDGITLGETHALVHHGRGRSTTVGWARVQAMTRERMAGRYRIALWTEDRRQILLAEPRSFNRSAHFEHSFQAIEQWWVGHRGPTWVPTLQIEL